MINVSRVIRSPRLRQNFNVFRSSGSFQLGGWQEDVQSPPYFIVSGIIYPSSAKEINQVPEADRVQGMMTFLCETELFTTHASGVAGTSDQIEWRGEKYKLIQNLPWVDYGYYAMVGSRLAGD